MSENEMTSFLLKMPLKLKEEYMQIAKFKGFTLTGYILHVMENHHHPLPTISSMGSEASKELQLINIKIDDLKSKIKDEYEKDEMLRNQLAREIKQIPQYQKIQEKIFRLLIFSPEPLSELIIASDRSIREDADIVLVVLSYLEQQKVIFIENNQKYIVKNQGMDWFAEKIK
jgi:hypothetical protein